MTLVVYVAVMVPYDPLLAVVGTGISSLNLVALWWMSRWRVERNRAIEQLRGRLLAGAMWAIQMIESVKASRLRVRPVRALERRPGSDGQRRAIAGR